MSLQDDIFDVADALKKKPHVAKAFENIMSVFNKYEQDNEVMREQLYVLKRTIKIVSE